MKLGVMSDQTSGSLCPVSVVGSRGQSFTFRVCFTAVITACVLCLSGCTFALKRNDLERKSSEAQATSPQFINSLTGAPVLFASAGGTGWGGGMGQVGQFQAVPVLDGRALLQNPGVFDFSLPSPKLELNHEVQRELQHYLHRDRRFITEALKRRAEHYPEMVKIFKNEGVPLPLINVALIESGFKESATSQVGAAGMWQFMKPTARIYGLKIDRTVDQRRDVLLSTRAAAKHLRELYIRWNDWHLALAAYNAGCGRLSQAIERAGTKNFWEIVRSGKLNWETSRFVPRFIASTLIVRDLEENGPLQVAFENGNVPAENQLAALGNQLALLNGLSAAS